MRRDENQSTSHTPLLLNLYSSVRILNMESGQTVLLPDEYICVRDETLIDYHFNHILWIQDTHLVRMTPIPEHVLLPASVPRMHVCLTSTVATLQTHHCQLWHWLSHRCCGCSHRAGKNGCVGKRRQGPACESWFLSLQHRRCSVPRAPTWL